MPEVCPLSGGREETILPIEVGQFENTRKQPFEMFAMEI
jgi:hypothetical protein